MSRLIDADALIYHVMGNGLKPITEQIFRKLIDDEPTIDAVEVVRCKECKWRKACKVFSQQQITDDSYCSWGESAVRR